MSLGKSELLDRIAKLFFRDIHEKIFIGTASDRYAGWLGQIYTPELYAGKITRRTKRIGKEKLVEEILPVESVREYFEHFRILEIDFTFYSLLLDERGNPTRIFRTLVEYARYFNNKGFVILKVPQVIFARKLYRDGNFVDNDEYLDVETFVRRFYDPALKILGESLKGFIFEQEYQRKTDRVSSDKLAEELNGFFKEIPEDFRYHVEFRTAEYLSKPLFEVLKKYGVGQVFSHWTWLPRLRLQFRTSGGKFFNSGKTCMVRLMTPRGIRYEDAYIKAYPFNKLVEDMIDQSMIDDTIEIMNRGINERIDVNVIINNRAGGNAPMIARMIAGKFVSLNQVI